MPLHPDYRHLYRGPTWEHLRRRILQRDGYCCQHCGKPDMAWIWVTRDGTGRWLDPLFRAWRDARGNWCEPPRDAVAWRVRGWLQIAHLDRNPRHRADGNLRALCAWCHFRYDHRFNRHTARRRRAASVGQEWLRFERARPRRLHLL